MRPRKFENVIFWCEFPEKVDWNKINNLFRKHSVVARTYVAVRDRKEFVSFCKRNKNIKIEGAWPILPKSNGYWFSGFLDKEDIEKLDEFKGLNLKIDIEPPLPRLKFSFLSMLFWLLRYMFKKQRNKDYLIEKIRELSRHGKIILSSFPLPYFILERFGFLFDKRLRYNFMFYSSLVPLFLKPFYKAYLKWFIRAKLRSSKNVFFAVGLISSGIFGKEPAYNNAEELRKDMEFLLRNGVVSCVVYSLEGILERRDPEKWIEVIKEFT